MILIKFLSYLTTLHNFWNDNAFGEGSEWLLWKDWEGVFSSTHYLMLLLLENMSFSENR
jgi:hypothetical protein